MSIEQKEDELFVRWCEFYKTINKEIDLDFFCPDGLHFMGNPTKTSGAWQMDDRNFKEEKMWNNATIRPLFLTKDHNLQGDDEGVDVRRETGYDNVTDKMYHKLYGKYLLLVYGLYRIEQSFKESFSLDALMKEYQEGKLFYDASPENKFMAFHQGIAVARMNLKKIAGGSECHKELLRKYIQSDFHLIREQISIYNPNILICCDGTERKEKEYDDNPIMAMLERMYPDLKKLHFKGYDGQFIYISREYRIIVLHEWHPSYRYISYESYFEAIPQLMEFLSKEKEFLKKNIHCI